MVVSFSPLTTGLLQPNTYQQNLIPLQEFAAGIMFVQKPSCLSQFNRRELSGAFAMTLPLLRWNRGSSEGNVVVVLQAFSTP